MIYSMTGFGRAEQSTRLGMLTAEISSVNNRFLDLTIRLPRQYAALEVRVKELVARSLSRGQVTIVVTLEEADDSPDKFLVNRKALVAYWRQLVALQKELRIPGDVTIRDMLILPDIAKPERQGRDIDAAWAVFEKTLAKALAALGAMRKKEGAAMATDMAKRLSVLKDAVSQVQKRSVNAVEVYREKLATRIAELTDPSTRNSARLEEEIAIFAERTDITEECTRLISHIDQFRDALKLREPVGKRLNFILQEMNREANTIGSKCSDFGITTLAITLKEEIEKLRELVQNVE
ncbi:MAG: YicC/YloC family endoribonuclease [Candidatus Zixiibacteriota bacterium]